MVLGRAVGLVGRVLGRAVGIEVIGRGAENI